MQLILKKLKGRSEVHTKSGEVVFISDGTKPQERLADMVAKTSANLIDVLIVFEMVNGIKKMRKMLKKLSKYNIGDDLVDEINKVLKKTKIKRK